MNHINPVQFQNNFKSITQQDNKVEANSFTEMLRERLMETNQMVKESEEMSTAFAAGEVENIHEVMIAGEKAKLAVNLTTAIQSKVLSAYKEIMRLQL